MGIGLETLTLKELKRILEETAEQRKSLFAEAQDRERWKKSAASQALAPLWQQVRERGDTYANRPLGILPFSEFVLFGTTGNRTIYESKYQERRSRLCVFALLSMLEGDKRWLTLLEDTIWAVCDECTWVVPAHVGLYHNDYPSGIWDQPEPPRETVDLFAGETAFALAEIVSLLEDDLHPWVVHRVKQEIDRRIFQVFFHDPVPQNWELKTNNWPSVCASSIGSAALYLVGDAERLSGMLWRVLQSLKNHISGFDDEGATPEGVGYWQYGFGFFVYFSELLRERTLGRVDLLSGEKMAKIARFPSVCLLSGNKVINFSDAADEIQVMTGLFSRLKRYFPDVRVPPDHSAPAYSSWITGSRNLLWSVETGILEEAEDSGSNMDVYYRGHQWVVSKTTVRGKIAAFAAKGGHNGEPHNHNDLGHFILHVDGVSVLADIGAGVYTRQYFQPEYRYQLLEAGSHGHSVPIVDGCRQGFGPEYRVRVTDYRQENNRVRFRLDLTRAYACDALEILEREFLWSKGEPCQLVVRDTARFARRPQTFEEVFIAGVEPAQIRKGGIRLGTVLMEYDADAWNVRTERHQLANGNRRIWRIVLQAVDPGREVACEVRFLCRDLETTNP